MAEYEDMTTDWAAVLLRSGTKIVFSLACSGALSGKEVGLRTDVISYILGAENHRKQRGRGA